MESGTQKSKGLSLLKAQIVSLTSFDFAWQHLSPCSGLQWVIFYERIAIVRNKQLSSCSCFNGKVWSCDQRWSWWIGLGADAKRPCFMLQRSKISDFGHIRSEINPIPWKQILALIFFLLPDDVLGDAPFVHEFKTAWGGKEKYTWMPSRYQCNFTKLQWK